jgi:hypothetical protein
MPTAFFKTKSQGNDQWTRVTGVSLPNTVIPATNPGEEYMLVGAEDLITEIQIPFEAVLLESGSFLLLETGDRLLLETS